MDNILTNILKSINERFPKGKHCEQINLMINGDKRFDYNEVLKYLKDIRDQGGSEKKYIKQNDIMDSNVFLNQLKKLSP